MKKLFVGGLSFQTTEQVLADAFAKAGNVVSAVIIQDRMTQRSKGFGFVEMGDAEGRQAVEALNQKEFNGKILNVTEARPREEKPRRSFDNNRGGYGGGDRGGNRGGGNRW